MDEFEDLIEAHQEPGEAQEVPSQPNAPSHVTATRSAKLSALHARLLLPSKLPLQTLARCLIDETVDSRPGYNNAPLAILGSEIVGLYTAEWLTCVYPRLPFAIVRAAQSAFVGPKALDAIRREWGVEAAAHPGIEVDPGLLQFQRLTPGNALAQDKSSFVKDHRDRSIIDDTRKVVYNKIVETDQFGNVPDDGGSSLARLTVPRPTTLDESGSLAPMATGTNSSTFARESHPSSPIKPGVTLEDASTSFVRALFGAIYLHAGQEAAQRFHKDHVLSRHLPLHTLFAFTHPTRDLSMLCRREGFEPPIARILSETGRLSRSPVFVVGVFSGHEKLGEGAGSSLDEARVRAAAAALRAWYLYSPPEGDVMLPSEVRADGRVGPKGKVWKAQLIDPGEVIAG